MIGGRNINKLRYAEDTTLMAENKNVLKSLFMKVKEESEKSGLKLNIQKMNKMASGPIISWQIDGEKRETIKYSWQGGSKITVDGNGSNETERLLPLGRKAMTNLHSILKSKDITLLTNVHLVTAIIFQWSCMDLRVGRKES